MESSKSNANGTTTPDRQFVVNANYEIFIVALSLLMVVNSIYWLLSPDLQTRQVITIIAVYVCSILIIDAIVRTIRSPRPISFLFRFHGWLLIPGSLPIPFFSLLRLLWYALTIRAIRRSEFAQIGQIVINKRAQSTLLLAILVGIVMLELSGILILRAELPDPAANIQDAGDALWWAIVTMATVGYGDKYPITAQGRIIGVFVIVTGVGLFSVLTSYLAHAFLRPRQKLNATKDEQIQDDADYNRLLDKIENLEKQLNQQTQDQRAQTAEILLKLTQIDESLPGKTPK